MLVLREKNDAKETIPGTVLITRQASQKPSLLERKVGPRGLAHFFGEPVSSFLAIRVNLRRVI